MCLSWLVDVFICWSDWFGPFSLKKEQRVVNLSWKKRATSLPGERLENLSQPPDVVERPQPRPPTPPPFLLKVFLKVSSLQSTTLMYVLLDLSSSAPIYFSKNTHTPATFCLLSLLCFYLPAPLVLFHPFEELC